jgi:hypothetical protein
VLTTADLLRVLAEEVEASAGNGAALREAAQLLDEQPLEAARDRLGELAVYAELLAERVTDEKPRKAWRDAGAVLRVALGPRTDARAEARAERRERLERERQLYGALRDEAAQNERVFRAERLIHEQHLARITAEIEALGPDPS